MNAGLLAVGSWLVAGGLGSRGHVHPAARNTGARPGPRQLHPIFDGKATAKPFATDPRQRLFQPLIHADHADPWPTGAGGTSRMDGKSIPDGAESKLAHNP